MFSILLKIFIRKLYIFRQRFDIEIDIYLRLKIRVVSGGGI